MKVKFPVGTGGFGFGTKQFKVNEETGECEVPDSDREACAAAMGQAKALETESEGLAAAEARRLAGSPTGQGQEFARALLKEILIGRAEPAPGAAAGAPAAHPAPEHRGHVPPRRPG